jgi:hypothetical protein
MHARDEVGLKEDGKDGELLLIPDRDRAMVEE